MEPRAPAPRVSIGLPFYNPGPAFERALQSVFAQTFRDWELILVDDGSTDGSTALARRLQSERVRLVSDGHNKGLAGRLNQISQLARGEYLVRMDADDIMDPERVQTLLSALQDAPANTVVGSAALSIDERDRLTGVRDVATEARTGFAARSSFIHPTVMARTEWFLEHPYSEQPEFRRCEDAELWCRAADTSEFINLQAPLLYYREVGVFSLPAYIGSGMGLATLLAARYRRPFGAFVVELLLLFAKMGVHAVASGFGLANRLVRRRSRRPTDAERRRFERGMARVRAQALPLNAGQ